MSNAPLRDEEYSADGPADPPLDPGVRFVRSVYGGSSRSGVGRYFPVTLP